MTGGRVDESHFLTVVGGAMSQAQSRAVCGRVRAYGEMVGILWQAGQRAALAELLESGRGTAAIARERQAG
jgi:hypothetical protein